MPTDWRRLAEVVRDRARAGFLYGVLAFWVSYVVMAVFMYFGPDFTDGTLTQWTSYYLFGAHNVPVTGSAMGEFGVYNVLQLPGGDLLPTAAYYVIPVVVLVAIGYAARSGASPNLTRIESTVAGSTVAIGYLASVLVAVFAFTRPGLGEPTSRVTLYVVGPELLRAVTFAGLAYPVVFGGIGGLLADPRP